MVHIAIVPHDQFGRGASCWIAMRGSYMYGGRWGTGRFLVSNDCRRALLRFACIRGGGQGISMSNEHLIHFRLLHEGYGRVKAKEFENTFEAILDVQVALPVSVCIVFDMGGA